MRGSNPGGCAQEPNRTYPFQGRQHWRRAPWTARLGRPRPGEIRVIGACTEVMS